MFKFFEPLRLVLSTLLSDSLTKMFYVEEDVHQCTLSLRISSTAHLQNCVMQAVENSRLLSKVALGVYKAIGHFEYRAQL